jgi:hypothetical protein
VRVVLFSFFRDREANVTRLSLAHAALCLTAAIGASAPIPAAMGQPTPTTPSVDFEFPPDRQESRRLVAGELGAGHFSLAWESDADEAIFIVESSPSEDFEGAVVYFEGSQRQAYISGLEEGEHYFRIAAKAAPEDDWGEWSEPASLTVAHHDLGVAFAFAGVGAALFLCIVVFVIVAPKRVEA